MLLSLVTVCMQAQFIWLCTNGGVASPRLSVLDVDGNHARDNLRWRDEPHINTLLQQLGQPIVLRPETRPAARCDYQILGLACVRPGSEYGSFRTWGDGAECQWRYLARPQDGYTLEAIDV